MSRKSRKLSLKKETLRSLDERQLQQVAGGDLDWYIVKSVGTVSMSRCDSFDGCYDFYFNYEWYMFG
jgi:hypothetical protein